MTASYGLFSIQIQITWSTLEGGVVTVPHGPPPPLPLPPPPLGTVAGGVGAADGGGGVEAPEVSTTSRGRPEPDSRDLKPNGDGDTPLTARLTRPLRVTSEVTSTETYALPRWEPDHPATRGWIGGAFA